MVRLLLAIAALGLLLQPATGEELHPVAQRVAEQLDDTHKPFVLIVNFQCEEGLADEVIGAFKEAVSKSRKEAGNLSYALSQSKGDLNRFTVYEGWKDIDSLQSHLVQPYTTKLLAAIQAQIVESPEILVHLPVAEPEN